MQKPIEPELQLIPYVTPPARAAAEFLLGHTTGSGAVDLRGVLVVVPTRNAGRRLMEALVAEVEDRGIPGVFPPRILTPNAVADLVIGDGDGDGVTIAGRAESLLCWAAVLSAVDPSEFSEVLPDARPEGNAWAVALGREIEGVRRELGEHGLGLADVVDRCPEEARRWRELAKLEALYIERLWGQSLEDRHRARVDGLAGADPPDGIERIVVLFVPDPLPLAMRVLERFGETLPVTVLARGEAADRADLDTWGRPLESWAEREIPIPDFASCVHLERGPAEQARCLARIAAGAADPAVGLIDVRLAPSAAGELEHAGFRPFDPAGESAAGHSLAHLIRTVAALVVGGRYVEFCALARCPAFLSAVATLLPDGAGSSTLLADLDEVREWHLPGAFVDLHRILGLDKWNKPEHAALQAAVKLAAGILKGFRERAFGEAVRSMFGAIFGDRAFDLGDSADRDASDVLRAAQDAADTADQAMGSFGLGGDAALGFAMLAEGLDEHRLYREAPAEAIELQGWLELQWEPAADLVLVGFNEGIIPQSHGVDAFLPDRLRRRLGIADRSARLARDAYLLHGLIAGRDGVEIILAKSGVTGDPLNPSRLLFRCPDGELPARAAHLFKELPLADAGPGRWSAPWKIRPPAREVESISVTGFKAYLDCPFRFYLNSVMRMERVDPAQGELDPAAFGNLIHKVLKKFGRDEEARCLANASDIEAFLVNELDREAGWRFGNDPAPAVALQLEVARSRLRWVAREQADQRAAGWEIVEAELRVRDKLPDWEIGGLQVVGQIDRIDRRGAEVRVLDYKTFDKPTQPEKSHIGQLSYTQGFEPRPYALDAAGGRYWRDLQIPLYCEAARRIVPDCRAISAGYFCIGKTASGVKVEPWEVADADLDWALACAKGVAEDIRAGRFWPPAAKVSYDDFEDLLFGRPPELADPPERAMVEGTAT